MYFNRQPRLRASGHWGRLATIAMLTGAWSVPQAQSLFFTSTEVDDVGRVEILVDGRPIDVGAGDFTLEFWMRSSPGNSSGGIACNTSGYNWISGNIVFDRDRLASSARDFGLAIAGGRIAFGVENSNGSYTICSDSSVLNGQWRHVAVQRRASDGRLWVHVDGVMEQEADGPDGDISYPNGQQSGTKEPLLAIGREKYDLGPDGYRGWLDEIRVSNVLRYQGSNFAVPTQPFALDPGTVALYHLDENGGDAITDENSNLSPGNRRYSAAAGPEWSTESPFGAGSAPGTLRLSAATYSENEGVATLAITVTRAGGTAGAASVDLGVTGGSATSGADYQFTPGTLSWNSGQGGPRTSTITIVDDALVEGSETIDLALSNATGASLGAPATAIATITDDDDAAAGPGVLQFSSSTYSAAEGTAAVAVTVTRTGGSSGAASVNVEASGGTATLNADYQLPATALTWGDAESGARTFNITLLNDALAEPNETIELTLSNPSGASPGSVATATATITDDDQSTPPAESPETPEPRGGGGGTFGPWWTAFGVGAALLYRRSRLRRTIPCRAPLQRPAKRSRLPQ